MRPRASGVLLPSILKSYFTSKSAQKRFIALEPWCILRSFASSLLPFFPLLICASIFFIIVFTYVSFHVFKNYFSCLVSQQQQPQHFLHWAAIKIYIIQSAFCSSYFVFLQFICNLIKSSTMLLLVYRVLTRAAWSSFLEASSNEHRERRSC